MSETDCGCCVDPSERIELPLAALVALACGGDPGRCRPRTGGNRTGESRTDESRTGDGCRCCQCCQCCC